MAQIQSLNEVIGKKAAEFAEQVRTAGALWKPASSCKASTNSRSPKGASTLSTLASFVEYKNPTSTAAGRECEPHPGKW